MSIRAWNTAFAVALPVYLVVGTALLARAMNADGDRALLLIVAGETLLLLAALSCPGWWALALPLVTFVPVGALGVAQCQPNFLDLCGLAWYGSAFVAVVIGLPVSALGTWLGRRARHRWSPVPKGTEST